MTRKRHTEQQIIAVLKDAQAEVSVQDLCRKHGILDATYADLEVSDVKTLRQLEEENQRLKQRVAEAGASPLQVVERTERSDGCGGRI